MSLELERRPLELLLGRAVLDARAVIIGLVGRFYSTSQSIPPRHWSKTLAHASWVQSKVLLVDPKTKVSSDITTRHDPRAQCSGRDERTVPESRWLIRRDAWDAARSACFSSRSVSRAARFAVPPRLLDQIGRPLFISRIRSRIGTSVRRANEWIRRSWYSMDQGHGRVDKGQAGSTGVG